MIACWLWAGVAVGAVFVLCTVVVVGLLIGARALSDDDPMGLKDVHLGQTRLP